MGRGGYPGTPAMAIIVAFLVFGIIRMTIRHRRIKHGEIIPLDSKHLNFPFVMIVWSFLLVMAVLSIWVHFDPRVSRLFAQ
jgi:hypothetical protein